MTTTFIYALCEPGARTVRYIGKADRPEKRFNQHVSCSVRHRSHLGCWLSSLRSRGLRPTLEILREVPREEWEQAEMRYIRIARALGMNLVNGSDGGEAPNHTLETRRRIAEKLRGQTRPAHVIEAIRKYRTGRTESPELKEKLSILRTGRGNSFFGRKHSLGTLEKMREAKLGKVASLESREKMSESRTGDKNHNFGKRMSEEQRKKISEALKRRSHKDPVCEKKPECPSAPV